MLSLDRLAERYEIRVWLLGHSDSKDQHGFAITAETMRWIGLLSADFFPDIFSSAVDVERAERAERAEVPR